MFKNRKNDYARPHRATGKWHALAQAIGGLQNAATALRCRRWDMCGLRDGCSASDMRRSTQMRHRLPGSDCRPIRTDWQPERCAQYSVRMMSAIVHLNERSPLDARTDRETGYESNYRGADR